MSPIPITRSNVTPPKLDPKKNTVDKSGVLRFDFLFSYWILVWFILFYFTPANSAGPISKFIRTHLNPALSFYFALVENMGTLFVLILYNPDLWLIFKFVSMVVLLKAIPLYLLQRYPIQWKHDTLVLFVIFGIYNVYLAWNDTTLYQIYERTITSIRTGDNQTPLYALLAKL
jgi:hypothetical protein